MMPGGSDFAAILPELVLAGGWLILLVAELVVRRRRGVKVAVGGAVLLAVVAGLAAWGGGASGSFLLGGWTEDGLTRFFRILFASASIISLAMLAMQFPSEGEPFLLVLASVLGMFLLAGAGDIIVLFVALEMVSIPSYVLAGYKRYDARSGEAALKYVLYGALSSGLMVYGLSLLFGLTGTTSLAETAAAMERVGPSSGAAAAVAAILILAGIGYKIAMVPMHFWCPDVYEGSPTPVTAFFSVVPKAAGLAALLRLMPAFSAVPPVGGFSPLSVVVLASAVTMTFGNLGAIWQDSLKRLLAYSSIAHAGYILMGFAVIAAYPSGELHDLAVQAVLLYLVVYMFMNLGAFLVVQVGEHALGGDALANFKGLGKESPGPALALAVFLFSLTGLPPLAGFIGKFYLFAALIKGHLFPLALIGVANTVVSLFYYVRVIRDMFLYDPEPAGAGLNPGVGWGRLGAVLGLVTVLPTVVLGVWWGPLARWLADLVG